MNIDMNILFDLVTPQGFIGGAGEYVRKVFYTLLESVKSDDTINLYVAIDTSKGQFAYKDLSPESLAKLPVKIIDLGKQSLSSCAEKYKISTVFIGMAQAWGSKYDIQNLRCRVICVIHDVNDYEYRNAKLSWYLRLYEPWVFLKKLVRRLLGMDNYIARLDNIIKLYNNNQLCEIITVSDYSKVSIEYLVGLDNSRIHVLYSPERVGEAEDIVTNEDLLKLIKEKKKYYLLLGANRPMKNAKKVLTAFKKYVTNYDNNAYIVTTGAIEKQFDNHIVLPYLNDSDLMNAYKNCYAFIFASFFEGFGYPPLEAMRFGKAVMASNVTSMPEILGNAAMYFSPFFETDIYKCFISLNGDNYKAYAEMSLARYSQISNVQKRDLQTLINIIQNN